jgi:glutamate-1-semialdehyde 2,1-aminomutase
MSDIRESNIEVIERVLNYLPECHLGSSESVCDEVSRAWAGRTPKDINPVIIKGKGSKLTDIAGNTYIDYRCGGGPMILGHCHPAVVQALQKQAEMGFAFSGLNEPATKLAELILDAVPCAEAVKFAASGSEACFYALRLARSFTNKEKILKFEGGYHGHDDYSITSFYPTGKTNFPMPESGSAGIPKAVNDTVLVAPFNDIDFACSTIQKYHTDLAAVIVEPVQRDYVPKPGFLSALRKVTSELGVILIFDEVATGFRLAYGGAQEYYGVIPDLATYAKALGGGTPISAVCGRKEIIALSNPSCNWSSKADKAIYFSGTLNGNPLSASAALATLTELQKGKDIIYPGLKHYGDQLRTGIREIAANLGIPVYVGGDASMWNVYFTDKEVLNYRSFLSTDRNKAIKFGVEMIKRGIFPFIGTRNFISAAHTQEDLDRTLNVVESALKAVRG